MLPGGPCSLGVCAPWGSVLPRGVPASWGSVLVSCRAETQTQDGRTVFVIPTDSQNFPSTVKMMERNSVLLSV